MLKTFLFICIFITVSGCLKDIRVSMSGQSDGNDHKPSSGALNLTTISDKSTFEITPILINLNNSTTNTDFDSQGNAITYACFYDNTVDGMVLNNSDCTSLTGVSLNTTTGIFSWTPGAGQAGNYEFKITGSAGSSSDDEIFSIEVKPAAPFVSKWQTTAPNETITLPLRAGFNYNMQVNWGDGSAVSTITSDADPDKTHAYAAPGVYTVTISGIAEAWYFNYDSESSKIIEVVDLGSLGWKNLEMAFAGCDQLTSFAGGDTSNVTNMSSMFSDNMSLSSIDLSSFDTSSVTDMSYMFFWAQGITALDVSNFDTSKVTNMEAMFGNLDLTSLDVSNFNTSAVTNMSSMFEDLRQLPSLDLSNFNTAAVTNMSNMFRGCEEFTGLDLSNFNTSAVTDMSGMFYRLWQLPSLDLSNFNTAAVTNMNNMFYGTNSLTALNLSSFNTAAVTDMSGMFDTNGSTSLDLSNFNTASVTTMRSMFHSSSAISLDLSSFNTSSVTDMREMFQSSVSLTSINLSSFDTSAVTTMNYMFSGTNSLASLNLSNFNTSAVTDMSNMFYQAMDLVSLDLSNFNTSSVTNMTRMFGSTFDLTSLNATNWNVSGVTMSANIWFGANVGLQVTCNQGGSPGTGSLFGKTCN